MPSTWTIINAEIIAWAKSYRGPRFHHILCDPPYALEFLGLGWDKPQVDFAPNLPNLRQYQQWVAEWSEVLIDNALYPGATCAFFGGTRTFHRLAAGLEDGGFEIFDVMMWMYSQGMAKGQNLGKAMDGTAFKEWLANIDHGLTAAEKRMVISAAMQGGISMEERHNRTFRHGDGPTSIARRHLRPDKMARGVALLNDLIDRHWTGPEGTLPPGVRVKVGERIETSGYKSINGANASIGYRPTDCYEDNGASLPVSLPATEEAQAWDGYNTTLKPAWEPVILCRAPRQGKTYVYLAQTYGTGALNVDAGRITVNDDGGQWGSSNENCRSGFNGSNNGNYLSQQHPDGRWPANLALAHDPGCVHIGQRQVKGITGSKNGSWRNGGQYNGGYAGVGEDELGQRLGYANADGTETVDAWACACGCNDCGAAWPAEEMTACPDCGGVNVEWLCPVKLLDEQAGELRSGSNNIRRDDGNGRDKGWSGWTDILSGSRVVYGDTGTASRFFYAAKVSPWEANAGCEDLHWCSDAESPTGYRLVSKEQYDKLPPRQRKQGNIHPTRKPVRLIEYLARILLAPRHVTPRVLIPFFGSGSEGAGVLLAAKSLGVDVEIVGVENEADYCRVGKKRLPWWAQFEDYEAARKTLSQKPVMGRTDNGAVQTTFLEAEM